MFKRKQKNPNEAAIIQAQIDYDSMTQSCKMSVRQWVLHFIDKVDGLPLDNNKRRQPDWFEVSKSHVIAILLELTDVEIKTLKSLLVVRTSDVDRLMTDALLNRCRGCDFLRFKMEQEQNGSKSSKRPPVEKTAHPKEWYYYDCIDGNGDYQNITVSREQLIELARIGQLEPDTVIKNDAGKHMLAREVEWLTLPETVPSTEQDSKVGALKAIYLGIRQKIWQGTTGQVWEAIRGSNMREWLAILFSMGIAGLGFIFAGVRVFGQESIIGFHCIIIGWTVGFIPFTCVGIAFYFGMPLIIIYLILAKIGAIADRVPFKEGIPKRGWAVIWKRISSR